MRANIAFEEFISGTAHSIGKSLAGLREEGVLIVGSGSSFHNMQAFFSAQTAESKNRADSFNRWLIETCAAPNISADERETRLLNWLQAPYARYCHPREEHLLPLHLCWGIASASTLNGEVVSMTN